MLFSLILFCVFIIIIFFSIPIKIKPKLNPDIGITTPNCPYCGIELKKFPGKKTKCKNCNNFIYVRTRPFDNQRILITEQEICIVQNEWDKKNGIDRKIATFDITNDIEEITNYLVQNYKNIKIYNELFLIDEKERLQILKYIWNNWDNRNNHKYLKEQYPQYDKDLLSKISTKEWHRITFYYRYKEFKELYYEDINSKLFLVKLYDDWRTRVCLYEDIMFIIQDWIDDEEAIIMNDIRAIAFTSVKTDYIYFYRNNGYLKFTPKEFKIYCKKNNLIYPFSN